MCRSTPNVPSTTPVGLAHRFEHGPLLDVQLEICARVDLFQLLVRVEHPVERDAVFRQRVHEPSALTILQIADGVDLQAAGRRGGAQQTPPESRAFLVGPVDELERDRRRRRGVHPQRFERRQ